jgi:GAF domain-containing protein
LFADHAAIALVNAELTSEDQAKLGRLEKLSRQLELVVRATHALAYAESLTDGLQNLAQLMAMYLAHTFCRVFLREGAGLSLVVAAAYPHERSKADLSWNAELGHRVSLDEWEGLASLLEEGKPWIRRMADAVDRPILSKFSRRLGLEKDIQSLLSVPLRLGDRYVGLLQLGEMRNEDRVQFSTEEIHLVATIAAQAGVLIDRMHLHEVTKRREEQLQRLHLAAQAMSKAFELKGVLKTIVRTAQEMMRADSATIWPYDDVLNTFIPEELETEGIPSEFLDEFRSLDPQPGGITYTVKDRDWIFVADVDTATEGFEFLVGPRQRILKQIGVRSFHGQVLKVGKDPVGVLYANYNHYTTLGEDDRDSMSGLATYAALSLKRARLLDRVTKARNAAEVVAKLTALGNRKKTLSSATESTLQVLGCDSVTLYVYDETLKKCAHPPTMQEAREPSKAPRYDSSPDSVIHKMLQRERRYVVKSLDEDATFRGTWFAKEEQIKSCVAIPLSASGHKVGVMFVNYRNSHRFIADELTDIGLFANQAAVAIRNAQLFDEDAKKLREQQALVDLSRELLGIVKPEDILDRAVGFGRRMLETDCCNIVLPDREGNLLFAAQDGWEGVEIGKTRMESGGGSQTGFTIDECKPVVVENYVGERRFTPPPIVFQNRIVSGLSVPMFSGEEVLGAMLVHERAPRLFGEAEIALLSLIANQATIALNSAQQYDAIRRKSAYLSALHEAGKAITASYGSGRGVLDQIVQQAVECVIGAQESRHGFGTVQLYEESTNELVFASLYSLRLSPSLDRRIGSKRSLGRGKIGITGRALLTRQPQRVMDVTSDPDYLEFDPRTRSELDVPLLENDKVLGILGIESNQPAAFDDGDLNTLKALAELAVVAIQNARQFEDLRRTKGLVGARTALAWMGMASSTWSHGIQGHAINIRNQAELLRSRLNEGTFDATIGELAEERLTSIEDEATAMIERRIVAPLSTAQGVVDFRINDFIQKRIDRLWEDEPYCTVQRHLNLSAPRDSKVRCSPEWLRQALDIIVDNAINSMRDLPCRLITIGTQEKGQRVEISIADTGSGIPNEILATLFKQVQKSPGSKGLGIGLLMAQVIIEAYRGDIVVESTGPAGTRVVISLPVE